MSNATYLAVFILGFIVPFASIVILTFIKE